MVILVIKTFFWYSSSVYSLPPLLKEGWVPKNWWFWILWCWWSLLRIPWTARRSNQSILKEINYPWIFIGKTDAEAKTSILWPPDAKSQFIEKDPDVGKIKGRRRRGWWQMARWLDSITTQCTWIWANCEREWRIEEPGVLQSMGSQIVRHDLVTEQQQHGDISWNCNFFSLLIDNVEHLICLFITFILSLVKYFF